MRTQKLWIRTGGALLAVLSLAGCVAYPADYSGGYAQPGYGPPVYAAPVYAAPVYVAPPIYLGGGWGGRGGHWRR